MNLTSESDNRDVVLGTRTRTRSRGTCILRYLEAGHLFAAG